MVLGDGHIPGIEPAIDDLGGALHLPAAFGTGKSYIVHVGTVQVERLFDAGNPRFTLQFGYTTHALFRAAAFTIPDRQGRAPVALP